MPYSSPIPGAVAGSNRNGELTMRKYHLKSSKHYGPTCQSGRRCPAIDGEHITVAYKEFKAAPVEARCQRCAKSKLFQFFQCNEVAA
jgi:hypothetical protein